MPDSPDGCLTGEDAGRQTGGPLTEGERTGASGAQQLRPCSGIRGPDGIELGCSGRQDRVLERRHDDCSSSLSAPGREDQSGYRISWINQSKVTVTEDRISARPSR